MLKLKLNIMKNKKNTMIFKKQYNKKIIQQIFNKYPHYSINLYFNKYQIFNILSKQKLNLKILR